MLTFHVICVTCNNVFLAPKQLSLASRLPRLLCFPLRLPNNAQLARLRHRAIGIVAGASWYSERKCKAPEGLIEADVARRRGLPGGHSTSITSKSSLALSYPTMMVSRHRLH